MEALAAERDLWELVVDKARRALRSRVDPDALERLFARVLQYV